MCALSVDFDEFLSAHHVVVPPSAFRRLTCLRASATHQARLITCKISDVCTVWLTLRKEECKIRTSLDSLCRQAHDAEGAPRTGLDRSPHQLDPSYTQTKRSAALGLPSVAIDEIVWTT